MDFENIETKQYLNVKINRNSNYGTIDNFYLFKFIQTTDSLKHIYDVLNSEKKVIELISELEKKEIIKNIDEWPQKTVTLIKK